MNAKEQDHREPGMTPPALCPAIASSPVALARQGKTTIFGNWVAFGTTFAMCHLRSAISPKSAMDSVSTYYIHQPSTPNHQPCPTSSSQFRTYPDRYGHFRSLPVASGRSIPPDDTSSLTCARGGVVINPTGVARIGGLALCWWFRA